MSRGDDWYGFDIETDTTIDGLDPAVAAVVSAALVGPGIELVLDTADEGALLVELDQAVRGLGAGVLVTWNGGGFDLPFVATRAAKLGLDLGLTVRHDPAIAGRHPALPGHPGHYRARWHGLAHLDAYQAYRADVGQGLPVSCGLKPLSRLVGLPVVEVDRSQIHRLDDDERRRYVASDAYLARRLALRRADAEAWVDRPETFSRDR